MVGAGSEPAPTISIVLFTTHRYTLRAFSSRARTSSGGFVWGSIPVAIVGMVGAGRIGDHSRWNCGDGRGGFRTRPYNFDCSIHNPSLHTPRLLQPYSH